MPSRDDVAALYDRYGGGLFRVAWALLRSRQDAEDAVQEVFIGVVRSEAAVENWRAYLFASLRHAAARIAARRPADARPVDDLPARESENRPVDPELDSQLEHGLASLPVEQREVLSLKIDGGLTFAEIAAVLNIRPNTAASRYRYALEKLRAILDAFPHETRPAAAKPA